MDAIQRSCTGGRVDPLENIVLEVSKPLRAKRKAHESPKDGKDSGAYSLKLMGHRNKNDALPDELQVINMFAAYFNQPNGTDWFFPTYFDVFPLRDPTEMGHWYLLVVHVKEKLAEILDSAPNSMRDAGRLSTRLTVKFIVTAYVGDNVFLTEVITDMMQHYGDDWSANYVSDEHRVRLIVECIRNPRNTVEGLQGIIKETLAHDGA
ncbi:hypothetical protein M0R45_016001 [Rubus argutus]|uniref:Ubiquitin-like protease family profile domain-containing protein n=1 Tax=Rubus argutus TaxID=59490 RepID=A0AAW1XUZ1_RUBAR